MAPAAVAVVPALVDRSACNYTPTNAIQGLHVTVHKECVHEKLIITVQFWYKFDKKSPSSFAVRYRDPSKKDGTSGSRILVDKYLPTSSSSGKTISTTVLARNFKSYQLELISNDNHCEVYARSPSFSYDSSFPDKKCKPY